MILGSYSEFLLSPGTHLHVSNSEYSHAYSSMHECIPKQESILKNTIKSTVNVYLTVAVNDKTGKGGHILTEWEFISFSFLII